MEVWFSIPESHVDFSVMGPEHVVDVIAGDGTAVRVVEPFEQPRVEFTENGFSAPCGLMEHLGGDGDIVCGEPGSEIVLG